MRIRNLLIANARVEARKFNLYERPARAILGEYSNIAPVATHGRLSSCRARGVHRLSKHIVGVTTFSATAFLPLPEDRRALVQC